jgi:hypothetical protein
MSRSNQRKVLGFATALTTAYLVAAEAWLPVRATADERSVVPDVATILDAGGIESAKYFSGVAYQFLAAVVLRVTGLDPSALGLLSPFLGGVVFGCLFAIGLLVYRREVDGPWWGFTPVVLAVLVFPGFVSRTWESSHKGYTFLLAFLAIYLVYRGARRGVDRRGVGLVVGALAGIALFNYVWGVVYAVLVAGVALHLGPGRRQVVPGAVVTGVVGVLAPAVSPLRRYHRAYFDAVKSQVDRIAPGVLSNRSGRAGTGEEGTNATNASDPELGGNGTLDGPTGDGASGVGPSHLGSSGDGGGVTGGITQTTTQVGEKIDAWPSLELLGLGVSSWYLYSLGIGVVAVLTAATGLACLYALGRRRLDTVGRLTLAVLAYNGVFAAGFVFIGDVATFKRVVVLPGVFGVLGFVVFLARGEFGPLRPAPRQRRVVLGVLLVVLLVSATLATNRTLVDGGQKPLDVYVDGAEVAQTDWLAEYGTDEQCYGVRQRVLAHHYRKETGGRIKQLSTPTAYRNTIYQSTPADTTAYLCR